VCAYGGWEAAKKAERRERAAAEDDDGDDAAQRFLFLVCQSPSPRRRVAKRTSGGKILSSPSLHTRRSLTSARLSRR